ncbi:MAG TPA: gfo/Idh/MocA family oxidoreductase [Anaerolineae bacterium]|nr:gfo/Idh/MocA family oxidoreductase [Anaerolineae bacterium]HIQ05282.1 gfo/Idh/MocA family oxidoreductase [Anaerolineae bacterium]
MLNFAIIGAGGMGRYHAHNLTTIPQARLARVASHRLEDAESLAAAHGARACDADAIFQDPAIDVVLVTTSSEAHKEYVLRAAAAEKHVFCEKPIALHREDAEEMITACEQAGVRFMVGHVVRFFPEFVRMKELLDEGHIGKPGVVRASRTTYFPRPHSDWYADFSRSGGPVLDLMLHDFDTLRWFFGEPQRVFARSLTFAGYDHLDYALATLRFESGMMAHVESSWAHRTTFRVRFEIAGDGGLITFDSQATMPVVVEKPAQRGQAAVAVPRNPLAEDPYAAELRHFCEHILKDTPLRVTPSDARKALEVGLAALESIRTGQPVTLGGAS